MQGGSRPISVDLYLCQATTVDDDGWILVQPDGYGEEGCGFHELAAPLGFISRPLDPTVDDDGDITAGTPMLAFIEGGKWLTVHLTDRRTMDGLPTLKAGESMQYGAKFNFVRCYEDGSVGFFTTTDGTATGQSVSMTNSPDGHRRSGPWGTETFDATGWHLRTTSGARLDFGGIGGLPAPLDTLGSYGILAASSLKFRSSIIALGPDGGIFDAAAKATPTLALFTAVQALLTALASPGGVISSTGPCTFGPAVAPALAALASLLATSQATLPAASTTVA